MSATTPAKPWLRYRDYTYAWDELGLMLDLSRMGLDEDFFERLAAPMDRAYRAMRKLERGGIANPSENRQVGHYWLRAPELAPIPELTAAITGMVDAVRQFAAQVHDGTLRPERAERFTDLLLIGIGGSALGPQFVADALGDLRPDLITPHFMDNTDPDGMDRLLCGLGERLDQTLCIVVSKSGGTPETANGLTVAARAYLERGLSFANHAVSVSVDGSKLDQTAEQGEWLGRFWFWDWVGGRTSETSVVGLLPAALQGIDIEQLLAGAKACDEITRSADTLRNPAALLALMWYLGTGGAGRRDLVLLPYRDRLGLFSRYAQQLLMESLGKVGYDPDGNPVAQGITVYGNKGSTDQHAYVQQLRDGVNNFFVAFIEVLEDGGQPWDVKDGVTCGDYLHALLLGTRHALSERGRQSLTITLDRLAARDVGVLIALFERAVGFYASLVNVNAYDQPGVEAGKRAATEVLDLQERVLSYLGTAREPLTAEEVARGMGEPEAEEWVFKIQTHLAANARGVAEERSPGVLDRHFRVVAR